MINSDFTRKVKKVTISKMIQNIIETFYSKKQVIKITFITFE